MTIRLSLTNERHQFTTDLDERELYAIGLMTVHWAILEHLILEESLALVERTKIAAPQDVSSLSFKKRLRAWRALVNSTLRKSKNKERLLTIINKIGNIERGRHRITHGFWAWDIRAPDRVTAGSHRPGLEFTENFDFAKMMKLADSVGEINFQLRYPKGEAQAQKEIAQSMSQGGLSVGREFAREVWGKGSPSLRHLLDIPPKRIELPPETK